MHRPGGIAAASLCATVVLPEPVPPAIPTTSGRCVDIAPILRDLGADHRDQERREPAADTHRGLDAVDLEPAEEVRCLAVIEDLVELGLDQRDEALRVLLAVRVDENLELGVGVDA